MQGVRVPPVTGEDPAREFAVSDDPAGLERLLETSLQHGGGCLQCKVDTALVRIPGASHGIASRPSQLMAKVAHILKWFDTYQ